MSVYCTLFSQTFYGLLFCYLTITDVHVTLYSQIIDFQFPSCCTSQPPKKLNQIITVNSSTNTPRSNYQKNNSCTLCVPMFFTRYDKNQIIRWTKAHSKTGFSVNDWKSSRTLRKLKRLLDELWFQVGVKVRKCPGQRGPKADCVPLSMQGS